MDPAQQQLLTEIRSLREEVKEMHSKVTVIWGFVWFVLLVGALALMGGASPVVMGGIILVSMFCFDRFILKKPKPTILKPEV